MYAIEFETDVKNEYIKIPEYEKFKFRHIKVVLMADQKEQPGSNKYNFDDLTGKLEWSGDAVSVQRAIRDEW